MPTAPADRFTLAPRVATTKPPAPKSSPKTQQILPNSSFSMPSCLSLCTVPSCSISCFLSSGPFSCSGPDISFSSRARSGSDPGWRSSSEPYRFLWARSWWRVSLLFWSSRAKASPENAKIGVTPVRHPLGTYYAAPPAPSPTPTYHSRPPLRSLSGQREQDEVDHHGQGDAQQDAYQEPEKAPSSHVV